MASFKNSCIIVVDPQRDFEQNGSLCVSNDANTIYYNINRILPLFNMQVASQDYHSINHSSFVDVTKGEVPYETVKDVILPDGSVFKQICWPVHCVMNTIGVKFSEFFKFDPNKLRIVRKGLNDQVESYSAVGDITPEKKFEKTALVHHLISNNITDVYLCGLAFDFCVGNTALDLVKSRFNIHILTDCTRYFGQKNSDDITNKIFSSKSSQSMFDRLTQSCVNFITSSEIPSNLISVYSGELFLPRVSELNDVCQTIYKILTPGELKIFNETSEFAGTPLDIRDGYIHMSQNMAQVERVKNKYYKDQKVYLLHINVNTLENLKYETISNGDIYPHLYGILKLSNVSSLVEL